MKEGPVSVEPSTCRVLLLVSETVVRLDGRSPLRR